MSLLASDGLDDINPLIDLESMRKGTSFTVFVPKQKPQKKVLSLDLDTLQIQMFTPGRTTPELQFDLFLVKEVRDGRLTKEFDRFHDEYRGKEDLSFVIFYGQEFRLKTVAIVADNTRDRDIWCMGLSLLLPETRIHNEPYMIKRWLMKEWQQMAGDSKKVAVKEFTLFLARAKLKKEKVKELLQKIDPSNTGTITFDSFVELYNLLLANPVIEQLFAKYSDGKVMTLTRFKEFLTHEQLDPKASDTAYCKQLMHIFADKGKSDPTFNIRQFSTFLLSKHNNVYNEYHMNNIYQNMSLPLSYYWISSSHNTYLTGDQFSSESTCEAYARCLRNGCRCIELDCWDGPDNDPIIYHGHTLTSKIKFRDVVETIKQHAFVTSPYPLILSIENHCCIEQQQVLATVFKDVFGDMLLTQVIDKNAEFLPSPEQLKHKILIKNRKLKEGGEDDGVVSSNNNDDLSQSTKNGYLLLEDPYDGERTQYYFVLTATTLHYGETTTTEESEEKEVEVEDDSKKKSEYYDLHFGEPWFHGKLKGGRVEAEQRLSAFNGPEGSFLIRESDTYSGEFTLSFWRQSKPNHVRIKSSNGMFFLTEHVSFPTLYDMVEYYRQNTLKSAQVTLRLSEHVPLPSNFEDKEWYHKSLSRVEAENMLKRCRKDGSFLVRRSETSADSFAISFLAGGKIKHCRIKVEGHLYVIGNSTFESLEELVSYYEKHSLYRKVKLKYPTNEKILEKLGLNAPVVESTKLYAKTLYDYMASRDDELSFSKDAIISNIEKHDGGWWRGEYNGKSGWLPSNYVEEIDVDVKELLSEKDNPLGSLQKGSIDLVGATITPIKRGDILFMQITTAAGMVSHLTANDTQELLDWITAISNTLVDADARQLNIKKMVRKQKVAKELSDIVVYCRSIPFESFDVKSKYHEMSSFEEKKAEKVIRKQAAEFVNYNKRQFSRTYPAGKRVDSSNFDPELCWCAGMQLVALNYQTPDRPMQVNEGMFFQNGRCGYVVKPDLLTTQERFSIFDDSTFAHVIPKQVQIQIFSAKHIVKPNKSSASPFIEIEICGAECDSSQKYRTKTKSENINPVWNESCDFYVRLPELALLRISVMDEDMFGDPNFMGQSVIPLGSIRNGYRAVPLRNGHSEEMELASVFIHINVVDFIPQAIGGLQDILLDLQEEKKQIQQTLDKEHVVLEAMQNMARVEQKKAATSKISKAVKESEKKIEGLKLELDRIEQEFQKLSKQAASNDPNAKTFTRKSRASFQASVRSARGSTRTQPK